MKRGAHDLPAAGDPSLLSGVQGLGQLVPDRRGREPFLVKASIAAGRDLPRIVVHGDAALDVIGGLSCD